MKRASELVLDGFALDTEVKVIRHSERLQDKRGAAMWTWMQDTLATL
jgi:hypothetical protein